jgi:hypothetical protein
MPKYENIKLELRFDAFNVFNHTNFISYNSNDVLTAMGFALTPAGTPAPNFFTCTSCQRPDGTFVGSNGQALHMSDLTHGKISSNLLAPVFGGLGDPAADDSPRKLQLSFHVRW